MRRVLIALAVAAVLLAGCTMSGTWTITVDRNVPACEEPPDGPGQTP